MRNYLVLACVATLPLWTAQLHAASHSIDMTANVPGVCTLSASSTGSGFSSKTSLAITITDGKTVGKTASMPLNYNCTVNNLTARLTSGNVGVTGPSPSGGKSNKIHYIARIFQNPNYIVVLDTDIESSKSENFVHSINGNIQLEIVIPSNVSNLQPGDYEDSLLLEIEPQA